MRTSLLLLTTPFILAACEADTDPSADGPATVTETIGDTTVVRTMSGSVWGAEATLVREISVGEVDGAEEYLFGSISSIAVNDNRDLYVLDGQAQHVRVFDSAGAYVATLGRRGEGPGEFGYAEAIALLPDGRLVVRDSRNQRISVFGPDPGQTDHWGFDSGNSGSNYPLHTDVQGRTYLNTRDLSSTDGARHIIVIGPDGTHLDTLPEPSSPYEWPMLTAEHTAEWGTSSTNAFVPFSPVFQWTVHPSGYFVTGLPSEYRINVPRDDGVLRIERTTDPPPIQDEERTRARERVVRSMRNTDPDWSWTGPPIPEHKPFYQQLLAGRNGRIWVRLVTEGHRVENEDYDPEDPRSEHVTWEEPLRYDVFEPDGTYLGTVVPPDGFSPYVNPVFDGDYVWGVTRDELGVERVVRFRIVVDGG
ncbi:MAG: 6-bladed beta-propeller [Gemmatimonadetes bacterium]|nr:6-bladed beta-propeller [Gemmatimonadota bacterium]MYH53701.1 6-bladed beta-propeller [Gemmatimonadota bacterium]MYK66712.1 6-bladed beta-propeller [Gemmatimonadota bacterium]